MSRAGCTASAGRNEGTTRGQKNSHNSGHSEFHNFLPWEILEVHEATNAASVGGHPLLTRQTTQVQRDSRWAEDLVAIGGGLLIVSRF